MTMSHVRSIDNSKSLYQKLIRTFERRPLYGEHQLDWVFDMAVTAWHLIDWYANETGETPDVVRARLKSACPELAVCQQICNGAKHLKLSDPRLKPFNISTDVYQTDDRKGVSRDVRGGDTNVNIVLTPVVKVIDRDRGEWEAIELFRTVVAFWRKELGQ